MSLAPVLFAPLFHRLKNATWASRRTSLWALLVVLVVALLGLLIWLAGRYESSLVQTRLEHDATETVSDIRAGLTRNIQSFQALQSVERTPESWVAAANDLLRGHREIMRLEQRTDKLDLIGFVETPFRVSVFERLSRSSVIADVSLACSTAARFSGPAYSTSYFMPQVDGLGFEVLDLCVPIVVAGRLTGYTVATYSLQDILGELVGRQLARGVGLSFTEADGTRLAMHGAPTRGNRVYVAHQLLDLPGNTLVIRMESRQGSPALFPNVLTALVTAMSMGLLAVLFLLGRDTRRRLKVEHDLGEALAFRKAMEDSVLTGLRARDLQGRITYVNPAFCKMVGVDAQDLLNQSFPSPYWPPELAGFYQQRQKIRLAGNNLPREGHESVFMRQDGTRFPVLIMEAPLINAVGKHTGWMSAILDVSEQRRIEELSRASQDRLQATARLAMVGEMASLLSHELNQPLAAISSYATGSLNLLRDQLANLADENTKSVEVIPATSQGRDLASPVAGAAAPSGGSALHEVKSVVPILSSSQGRDLALPVAGAAAPSGSSALQEVKSVVPIPSSSQGRDLALPVAGAAAPSGGSALHEVKSVGAISISEDLQLAMRRISEQAERAGRVIKSVHDFVRRRDQVREPTQPRALLDAIMPLVSLQARKLAVSVVIEVDEACPPVLCDRTMVEQVLLNLSRNGMQAMQGPEDAGPLHPVEPHEQLEGAMASKVLVLRIAQAASRARSHWVEFSVTDGGEGISAEVADKLFTPFFTTKLEGMGLGLSLCRTVIEQHGGFLRFEAVQPQGTIFSFTLPVAPSSKDEPDIAHKWSNS